jgi:hypothetical protein
MGEENAVEIIPAGMGLAAQEQRLERQVRMLEDLLERVSLMMGVERPVREQMQVMELMGRTALRLGMLVRTQKQVAALIYVEEERERQRRFEDERQARQDRRMEMDEKERMASIEEHRKTQRAKRVQIAIEMGLKPGEDQSLYGDDWDPDAVHWK